MTTERPAHRRARHRRRCRPQGHQEPPSGVYPPIGRVRVAAPQRLDDEAVRLAVISRLAWIRRSRQRFEQQARQSQREMVTGESHYVQGRRYRLEVDRTRRLRHRSSIAQQHDPGTAGSPRNQPGQARSLLQRWYRRRLREQIPQLIAKWEPKIGVTVAEWRIRKMKTRWGTCNARRGASGSIWNWPRNPPPCLEYIVVHEMVHLLERRHNEHFKQLHGQVPAAVAAVPRRAEPLAAGA